jgi:hypothetical protein
MLTVAVVLEPRVPATAPALTSLFDFRNVAMLTHSALAPVKLPLVRAIGRVNVAAFSPTAIVGLRNTPVHLTTLPTRIHVILLAVAGRTHPPMVVQTGVDVPLVAELTEFVYTVVLPGTRARNSVARGFEAIPVFLSRSRSTLPAPNFRSTPE